MVELNQYYVCYIIYLLLSTECISVLDVLSTYINISTKKIDEKDIAATLLLYRLYLYYTVGQKYVCTWYYIFLSVVFIEAVWTSWRQRWQRCRIRDYFYVIIYFRHTLKFLRKKLIRETWRPRLCCTYVTLLVRNMLARDIGRKYIFLWHNKFFSKWPNRLCKLEYFFRL